MGNVKEQIEKVELIEKIIRREILKDKWQILQNNGNWYPIGLIRDCIKSALAEPQLNERVLPISGVVKSVCSCDKGFSDVNDPEHICDNCGLPTT